jgi:AraC family transcriptional regulator
MFRHRLDEIDLPPLSNHLVVVHQGRPSGVEERIDGRVARRYVSRGGVTVVPAGVASEWRWEEAPETLHTYLSPALVEEVAAESGAEPDGFEILDALGVRDTRIEWAGAALLAELEGGGLGDNLYAESVAGLLAVHLLRDYSSLGGCNAARKVEDRSKGGLPGGALRRALDYMEENLPQGTTQPDLSRRVGSAVHAGVEANRGTGTRCQERPELERSGRS